MIQPAAMTEREALKWLAAPEPEPFRQVRPSAEDHRRLQEWRDRTTEALILARPLSLGRL